MANHIPVLLHESIDLLDVRDGKTYLDLTLGRAGHSSEILKKIPHGLLIAFDQDEQAIVESKASLESIGKNFKIVHRNFMDLEEVLQEEGISGVDGILADLGVSSPQLDEANRGFSYKEDAPLDMRMDQSQTLSAKVVVNTYSLNDLARVINDYGEDKDAYRIAKAIVKAREKKPIETTFELVDVIKSVKSAKELAKKGHPAKQTFQAIRIEVNHEEEALEKLLEVGPKLLNRGGRMAIITFMSLDDRLVKKAFRKLTTVEGSRTGYELPGEVEEADYIDLTKKPILPSEEELEANRRATSSKLRGIQRK